jgi:FKBP-type peptidyl-prolyl cis-trans isomerase
MKNKWTLLLCLGLLGLQAQAQPAAATPSSQDDAAKREQLLKGGKVSPRERAALAKAALATGNAKSGADFLAANAAKPGVVTLPSGVQYRVLKAGAGKRALEGSSIRMRYQGTLVDGSIVDKSDDKMPAEVRVAGLMPGLKEAVKLMPQSSKWEVVVPAPLAYGAQGYRAVGPNAVLVYVIELLGVN